MTVLGERLLALELGQVRHAASVKDVLAGERAGEILLRSGAGRFVLARRAFPQARLAVLPFT